MTRRPLVAGNWKMNGLSVAGAELKAMIAGADGIAADLVICPPATLVAPLAWQAKGSVIHIGGQDCHPKASGAHTGDIAAEMLKDAGATFVIVGHSERRTDHGESDSLVRAKAETASRAGLVAILCLGETHAEREAGKTLEVVGSQLASSLPDGATPENTVIAYEPVWAIGTGLTPTNDDIADVHRFIRGRLGTRQAMRVLYGGSVKPANAAEILRLDNVDGALVGGASLKAADFLGIASVYR